ncbi:hypothetical protein [Mycobacteroides abscessus]|uniref:hypothetical protein n=1 Tax=Mycobacteroides abscessus TaxID=36809 RepID=UPI000940CC6B|nr:hypothetical protein [Mycobacteroides abscessus]
MRPLADDDLVDSQADALARIEALAVDRGADLGQWQGNGPALSVYVQWAIYALRGRNLISMEESLLRLGRVAVLQQKNRLYPGHPGIHYGRPGGWEAPIWWGTEVHKQHQLELIARAPQHYSMERFEYWAQQRDWRWAR